MSFGSLSENTIVELNQGALKGKLYHNTGKGGLTQFRQQGGDVCGQIGTGCFDCRYDRGVFDGDRFAEKVNLPKVKMIEIKLSQAAKPGHGGVFPVGKNTVQIAKIRGVLPNTTILSPPSYSAFKHIEGLIPLIAKLRQLYNLKPIGFKLCIADIREFKMIC